MGNKILTIVFVFRLFGLNLRLNIDWIIRFIETAFNVHRLTSLAVYIPFSSLMEERAHALELRSKISAF